MWESLLTQLNLGSRKTIPKAQPVSHFGLLHSARCLERFLRDLYCFILVCHFEQDKSAHGRRKAAATRAADNGATAHALMAIFGWIDIKEAEIYTRAADRKRLAARAMGKLET